MTERKYDRWLRSHRAPITRDRYEFALRRFCEFCKVTPEETLQWEIERVEDNIQDWIVHLRDEEGLRRNTIYAQLTGVKSWFKFNRFRGLQVDTRSLPKGDRQPKYIPTQEQVREIIDALGLRPRTYISLMAFSGMRPVDIATLQYRHIRESFEADDDILTIHKRQEKTGSYFVTFLGYQGTRYLRSVIGRRRLQDDDYIFTRTRKGDERHVSQRSISWAINAAIKRSVGKVFGVKTLDPYSLRRYFRRQLMKAGIDQTIAECLMGHANGLNSLTARYTGLIDGDQMAIETLKEEYRKAIPYLETDRSDDEYRDMVPLDVMHEMVQEHVHMELMKMGLAERRRDGTVMYFPYMRNTSEDLEEMEYIIKRERERRRDMTKIYGMDPRDEYTRDEAKET